jgi:hypothetical protein
VGACDIARPPRRQPTFQSERTPRTHRSPGRENPRWAITAFRGELLGLGCSHLTIGRVLRGYGLPPAPRHSQRRWRDESALSQVPMVSIAATSLHGRATSTIDYLLPGVVTFNIIGSALMLTMTVPGSP